ncbi:uncharacterized protein LOC144331832 isoform X2 [Macaca mulatta]
METGVMGIHQEVCIWEVQGSLAAHPDTGPHGDMGKRRDAVALELAGCVADKQGSRRLPWRPQAFYHAGGLLPLFPPQLASPPSTHFQSAWAQESLGSAAVESVISGGRGSRFRKPWLCCFNFRGDLGQGA